MQFNFVSFDSVLYLVQHFNESIIYIFKINVHKKACSISFIIQFCRIMIIFAKRIQNMSNYLDE